MSKYTITIQEYCQGVYVHLKKLDDPTLDPVAIVESMEDYDYYDIVKNYIFPTEWPFYNSVSDDRDEFVEQFTDEFLYYEIGQSSMGQFRHNLKKWLRINMNEYAQLYRSQVGSLDDLLKTVDVWRTSKGKVSDKTGTISREGSVTYGKTETRDNWQKHDGTFTNGRIDNNAIVPLGSSATYRDLSKQTAGGTDITGDTTHDAGNVGLSGTDENEYTDTYALTDETDITEHRAGRENINVGDAVEKYRSLIIDINSLIFSAMRKYGLFMLLW